MPCRGLRQRRCDPALGQRTPGTANGVGVPQYALCDATVIWCSRKRTTSACSGRSRSASAAAEARPPRPASRPLSVVGHGAIRCRARSARASAPRAPAPPRRSRARRRASRMSAITSADRGAVVVLDEVRVHGRDAGAADGVALEAALLEQAPGRAARRSGFFQTEPNVRTLAGCASLPPPLHLGHASAGSGRGRRVAARARPRRPPRPAPTSTAGSSCRARRARRGAARPAPITSASASTSRISPP